MTVEDGKTFITTDCGYKFQVNNVKKEEQRNRSIILSIRPEEFLLNEKLSSGIRGTVHDCVFLGLNTHYFVKLSTGQDVVIIQESSIDGIIPSGTEIFLDINTVKINIFSDDGSVNILEGVTNDIA